MESAEGVFEYHEKVRFMFKGALSIFFAIIVIVPGAFADQVSLSNGDRLSGSIVSSNRESMMMKTEFLGDVTIQWDAIEEITSEEQLFLPWLPALHPAQGRGPLAGALLPLGNGMFCKVI